MVPVLLCASVRAMDDFFSGDFDWDDVPDMGGDDSAGSAPSPEDVSAALDQGLVVFSKIFGTVVSVVGGIATLADGTQVPVAELGDTAAGGELLAPAPWIAGVPNVATIGFGLVGLILLLKYA